MPQTVLDIKAAVRAAFHDAFGSTDGDDSDIDYVPETVAQAVALKELVATNTGLAVPRDLFVKLVKADPPLPQSDPQLPGAVQPEVIEDWVDAPVTVRINGVAQALFDAQSGGN